MTTIEKVKIYYYVLTDFGIIFLIMRVFLNIVLDKYNQTFVEDLVAKANEMGGKDNITVAYYKIQ